MIDPSTIEAFNSRLTVDLNSIKKMTPSQLDAVKHYGSQAEALLKNRDLALFIHHFKFEVADTMSSISGHTQEDNARRVALSNELRGIDQFIATLQRAVYMKNMAVTQAPTGVVAEPADPLKREYN
jgi:phosphoribosylcarboxyaminoimidazole (NCAIR) mutase